MTMSPTTRMVGVAVVTVTIIMTATLGYVSTRPDDMGSLKTFSSELELRLFLTRDRPEGNAIWMPTVSDPGSADFKQETSGSYSTTNIQVAGVDEEDTVKTDGEYIYAASSSNVTIVKAYPPESLEVVSVVGIAELPLGENGSRFALEGMFVHGEMLVIIMNAYPVNYWRGVDDIYEYKPPKVIAVVYNVSDRGHPVFLQSNAVSGSYLSSRMVDDCLYLVTQSGIWGADDDIVYPSTWKNDVPSQVEATDIGYDPETRQASSFLNIMAVDVNTGEHNLMSVISGRASIVYMSSSALYFTIRKYESTTEWVDGVETPVASSSAKTTIYKVEVNSLSMSVAGEGDVRGWLLNQFSMDEHSSHLRVATTTEWQATRNAVYVLDEDMDVVGKLEGLAPSERIYSSRFIGDILYLVTFRQVDPLFVIDLKDPEDPTVIGELKITGFSTYLHPVDDNHVLGLGLEDGRLKVSLFNVSDPADPREQSKYICDDFWWYSNALYDHKAVLFDLERELLVLPGYGCSHRNDWYQYNYTSGALVLRVSVSEGISLRGVVANESQDGYSASETYSRSLYIGDHLYTVSQASILVHQLDDLSFVDRFVYSEPEYGLWYVLSG